MTGENMTGSNTKSYTKHSEKKMLGQFNDHDMIMSGEVKPFDFQSETLGEVTSFDTTTALVEQTASSHYKEGGVTRQRTCHYVWLTL